jgi:hypothetical protein
MWHNIFINKNWLREMYVFDLNFEPNTSSFFNRKSTTYKLHKEIYQYAPMNSAYNTKIRVCPLKKINPTKITYFHIKIRVNEKEKWVEGHNEKKWWKRNNGPKYLSYCTKSLDYDRNINQIWTPNQLRHTNRNNIIHQ